MNKIIYNIRKLQRSLLDGMARHNSYLGVEKRVESFVNIFENHIPPRSNVLDIGGGWGFYDRPLRQRGHRMTVLDVVKPRYRKVPVVVYDGEHMPFPDKSFDVSLCINILHHVPDPKIIIMEARRVTHRFVIIVENLYNHRLGRIWTIIRDRLYNFEFFGHPCQFKKKSEWIQLFERFDYRLVAEQELYTWLAGMRNLNGVFIFEVPLTTVDKIPYPRI